MVSRIDIGPEGGPFVAINENSNDLELQDINGNVIAKWDETAGQWDFNNNSLTGINTINASSVEVSDELNALGISFQNLEDGQVAAGDGSGGLKAITPDGAEIQSGTVSQTLDDAPADDTWGTSGTNDLSVSFPEAFSETPVVVASGSVPHAIRGVISVFSVSTTGFNIRHYQFADRESDSGDVQWVAIA